MSLLILCTTIIVHLLRYDNHRTRSFHRGARMNPARSPQETDSAGLLLLSGRLGDLIGRRRVFMAGLAVFTIASLLCGLAQSQSLLIGARFVQGVGGALTSAGILGMIVNLFPEPREQAKAIGI